MGYRSFHLQFVAVTRRVAVVLRGLLPRPIRAWRRARAARALAHTRGQATAAQPRARRERPELDLRRSDFKILRDTGGPAAALLEAVLMGRTSWRRAGLAEALAMATALGLVLGIFALVLASTVATAPGLGWPLLQWISGLLFGLAVVRVGAVWLGSHRLAMWAWDIGRVRDPEQAEQLRSGLQLATELARGELQGSASLTELALQQAVLAAAVVDAAAKAARDRAIHATQVGAITAVAAAALFPVWPAEILTLLGESPVVTAAVRDVGTVVGDSRIQVEAPTYARQRLPLRQEDGHEIEALRGSQLEIAATPLPGLSVYAVEVSQQLTGGERVEIIAIASTRGADGPADSPAAATKTVADLASPRQVNWSLTLLEPVKYRYRARDAEGKLLREASWRELKTRPDPLPVVILAEPTGELEVRTGDKIGLQGRVVDDLGIQLVELVIARPGGGVERRPLAAATTLRPAKAGGKGPALDLGAGGSAGDAAAQLDMPLEVSVTEVIDVDALQLRAGETAVVHLEAADGNPLGGNRRAQSDKLRLRMFSAERHHSRSLDALAAWTEYWTLRLADRLEQDPATEPLALAPSMLRRNTLAEAERKGLAGLAELRQALTEDVLTRPRTLQDLIEIERQLSDPLADEDRALAKLDVDVGDESAVASGLQRVGRLHTAMIEAEEKAVYALSQLAAAEHQQGLARESQQVAETEEKLMDTLQKLADGQEGALEAEAERLLDQLESQLDKMAAAAAKQARVVPYEHLNAQGLDPQGMQKELSEQRGGLQEIRDLLRQGKTKEAAAKMQALREAMQATREDVQAGAEQPLSTEEKALQQLVQEVRRGVEGAKQAEEQLRDNMRPLSESAARAGAEQLERLRESVLPELAEQVRMAEDALRQSRLSSGATKASAALQQARAAMQAAKEALGKAELDGALQRLQEAQDGVARALEQAQSAAERGDPKAEGDARRLQQGLQRLDAVAEELRGAMPRPDQLLGPQDLQRSAELSRQQAAVQRTVDKLRQRLAESTGSHPALQKQVGDRLAHASQLMREAAERLAGGEARAAFEQTAEAMDALERAAQLLDQRGEGNSGSQQQGEAVGMSSPDAAVELRSGGSADTGEAYRRQVLRAMQREQPGSWQDRLQKYYKAIAR
jgi:hypothetical protein